MQANAVSGWMHTSKIAPKLYKFSLFFHFLFVADALTKVS